MNTPLSALLDNLGFLHLTTGMLVMWVIGLLLIYLAIARDYEPLLLLPIGFGILLANLPLTGLMTPEEGLLWKFYHYGIQWEVIPPLIFLGIGALTDFGPLLARPSLIFLGAGAQAGVFITFVGASAFGFICRKRPPSVSSGAPTAPPPFSWRPTWPRTCWAAALWRPIPTWPWCPLSSLR
jgi:Na+-transporting methylmalonyl-CoA/oxaloacetate decarboxylase beta subunit